MEPTEVVRLAVEIIGGLVSVIEQIEAAMRHEDPKRVREILAGELLTTTKRARADLLAALKFGPRD